ncbi:MAG: hypothetical protein JO346_13370 [Alphaproteobacteria bacterium]|nr:hypothetical protein [Alphaproteobacteria bacterium]
MFNGKLLQRAAVTGIVLQLALVVICHFVPWVRANYFEFGLMMFAGLAGLFYARDYGRGYGPGALGGAIAGGTSGIIGVSLANILGDLALVVLPLWMGLTVLTGAIGGLFGQMGANIRKMF